MSDDFHRPTYTSADEQTNAPTNKEGRYNPTQVRLYGIPGLIPEIFRTESVNIITSPDRPVIEIDLADPARASEDVIRTEKLLDVLERNPKQPIMPEANKLWAAAAGIPLPAYFLQLSMRLTGTVYVGAIMKDKKNGKEKEKLSAGIMFGYAYEGHTYDFPKPKIMLVLSLPLVDPSNPYADPLLPLTRPADDSGYDAKYPEGYRVWIVDKLDQCVELEVNQGFIEEVVLEANLPGKRSPSQYRAMMALSHRSGRLSE